MKPYRMTRNELGMIQKMIQIKADAIKLVIKGMIIIGKC